MAICTQCGAIMMDEDMTSHKCDPINLPTKSKEKIPTSVISDMKIDEAIL